MKTYNLSEFHRGWFIGNFDPSILKTDQFELAVLQHNKGEVWPKHYHAVATEYNVLIKGQMTIANQLITPGTIFVLEPNQIADPVFHEDCTVICFKIPSVPGDKYELV